MNFAYDGDRTDCSFVSAFTQMIMPAKSRNRHPNFLLLDETDDAQNQEEKTGMTPQPLWCRRQPAVRKFNKLLKKKPFNQVEGLILYYIPVGDHRRPPICQYRYNRSFRLSKDSTSW